MTLLFTDIHFGLKLNSELFLDIAQNNVKWIEEQIKKYKVDKLVFCGDWFHQRSAVSVNTLHKAYESLKSLSSRVKEFYMIVGNHDSYYKNSTKVHSLKTFEQFNNIKVIDSLTEVKLGKFKTLMVPWGIELEELKEHNNCDIMFGHFEPNGVKVMDRIMEFGPYSADDLIDICPLVFSGHYHQNNEHITDKGNLIFIGSPSQQNWGDCNESRGAYILDESTKSYFFVPNDDAPIHKKFLYSELIKKNNVLNKDIIKNNFIKIIIDCQYKFDVVQNLIANINKLNPISVEAEYFYSDQIGNVISKNDDANNIKTHEDYIKDFINDPNIEFPEGIDREKLLGLALAIFKKAQEKDEAEENE
jgi:DNA repair exonuclease SbcCD nuclease subunit